MNSKNIHKGSYNFKALTKSYPLLADFTIKNRSGKPTIDFFNPDAVLALNTALLMHFYDVGHWSIPKGYLCPPIPGRADYIHSIADLLSLEGNEIPRGSNIKGIDIGVGANAVYPIIGHKSYGWSFVGTDIDPVAIENAQNIVNQNDGLGDVIEILQIKNRNSIYKEIIKESDRFDFSMCNPPFHASKEEATKGSVRKLKNLTKKRVRKVVLNFGGNSNELWFPGGEVSFIENMIKESAQYKSNVFWFTTIVSKQVHLDELQWLLSKQKVAKHKTIKMMLGQKQSHILAWTFLNPNQQELWRQNRWTN